MSDIKPQALRLLRKASDDLHDLICLSADPATSLWSMGFHAQQAVEKALKAVLMQREVRYPFTHGMLDGIELHDTLFRMNHVSNLIALGGRLPADKAALLEQIDALIPRVRNEITCVCTEEQGLML